MKNKNNRSLSGQDADLFFRQQQQNRVLFISFSNNTHTNQQHIFEIFFFPRRETFAIPNQNNDRGFRNYRDRE